MVQSLGHVKLIISFSDTDFQKNDERGRVFNFCLYMHIGPIFRFHFIDCYHSELPEVTTLYNQRKTQECSEFLQCEIGVVSLWSIQVKRHGNLNADFFADTPVSENQIIVFRWPYKCFFFKYTVYMYNVCHNIQNRQMVD